MPLFFFLSGFLMYKANRFNSLSSLYKFIQRKAKVQLIPTLIFSLLFAFLMTISYKALLLDRFKGGYWFTYTLFFYFGIYAIGDFFISKWAKGIVKTILGLIISTLIFAAAKYAVVSSCPWFNSDVINIIGIPNFQFFGFFFFGALTRAHFKSVERLLEQQKFITVIIVGFILLQLILQVPVSKDYFFSHNLHFVYTLFQSFTGFIGIIAVFIFFRKNEAMISNSRIGIFFKYIGVRTLDIYLIHLFFVYTNMHFIGAFLENNFSLVSELLLGSIVTLLIIGLCLLISQFIRSSDTLAKLLFGKVISE